MRLPRSTSALWLAYDSTSAQTSTSTCHEYLRNMHCKPSSVLPRAGGPDLISGEPVTITPSPTTADSHHTPSARSTTTLTLVFTVYPTSTSDRGGYSSSLFAPQTTTSSRPVIEVTLSPSRDIDSSRALSTPLYTSTPSTHSPSYSQSSPTTSLSTSNTSEPFKPPFTSSNTTREPTSTKSPAPGLLHQHHEAQIILSVVCPVVAFVLFGVLYFYYTCHRQRRARKKDQAQRRQQAAANRGLPHNGRTSRWLRPTALGEDFVMTPVRSVRDPADILGVRGEG